MKPYIICHMMQSVDGRIACDMVDKISGEEYYTALESLDCLSVLEGKYSYQLHTCGFEKFIPKFNEKAGYECFYKSIETTGYEISVDNQGELLWDKTENKNRLCILSEEVSKTYLDYLREKGISYIVTGKDQIDLKRAVEILYENFGVRRLAIVGGGRINGAFLEAGLLNELSVMIAPGIDGRTGQPSLFDGIKDKDDFLPKHMFFKSVSNFPNGVVWIRYEL
ncbi:MAG: dihydrofolate reductase family protein [Muribaculaceae bacterium]|nr:dihydrofolate reductase family protein [Muribaculaceae bacterium]